MGVSGWLVTDGIARISVPIFFLINGYFLYHVISDKNKSKKYILHIITIYVVWVLIYFPTKLLGSMGWKSVIFFIITGYTHLWYLVSLIWASILLLFVKRFNPTVILVFSFLLFFCGLFIQKAGLLGIELNVMIQGSRNFLFMGFPFVFIGYYINKKRIEDKGISLKLLIGLSLFFLALLLAESYYLYLSPLKNHHDFYVSLIFLCPLLFLLVMKISRYKEDDGYISKLASAIYFVHMLVIGLIRSVSGTDDLLNLPAVILLSTVISAGIIVVNKRIKIFL